MSVQGFFINKKEPQPLKVAAENDQFSMSWIYDYPLKSS